MLFDWTLLFFNFQSRLIFVVFFFLDNFPYEILQLDTVIILFQIFKIFKLIMSGFCLIMIIFLKLKKNNTFITFRLHFEQPPFWIHFPSFNCFTSLPPANIFSGETNQWEILLSYQAWLTYTKWLSFFSHHSFFFFLERIEMSFI